MEAPKVFISHATEDNQFVKYLVERLKSENIAVWVDFDSIRLDISDEIDEAIEECPFFIVVYSHTSIKKTEKPWVNDEIKTFRMLMNRPNGSHRIIFPVLLGVKEQDIPTWLQKNIYHSFQLKDDNEQAFIKLIKCIKNEQSEQGFYFHDVEHLNLISQREKPSHNERLFLRYLLNQKPIYRTEFFKELNSPHWFPILKEDYYFSLYPTIYQMSTAPTNIRQKNPEVEVYAYLTRIAQLCEQPTFGWLLKGLFELIQEHTEKKIKGEFQDQWLFAFHIYYRILAKIPPRLIPLEIIKLIPHWINPYHLSHLLVEELIPRFFEHIDDSDSIQKGERLVEFAFTVINVKEKQQTSIQVEAIELQDRLFHKGLANQIGQVCSNNLVFYIADELRKVCVNRLLERACSFEINNKTYQLLFSKINNQQMTVEVSFVKPNAVVKRNQEQAKTYGFSEELFLPHSPDDIKNKYSFALTDYHNRDSFVNTITQELDELNLYSIDDSIETLLMKAHGNLFIDFFTQDYPDIGNPPSFYKKNAPLIILITFLKELLLAKAEKDAANCKLILEKFWTPIYFYPIFRRLALFVISKYWQYFREVFWGIIDHEDGGNIFQNYNYRDELVELLKNNVASFTDGEKTGIINIIENISNEPSPSAISDEVERQKWYSVLKDDPDFLSLYDQKKKVTDAEPELIPRGGRFSISSGTIPPPESIQLPEMETQEFISYLQNYKSSNEWRGHNLAGLCSMLTQTIKDNSKWLNDRLNAFVNIPFPYIKAIIRGYNELIDPKIQEEVDWEGVFNFMYTYVQQDTFWKNALQLKNERASANHSDVIMEIANLMTKFSQDESKTHTPNLQKVSIKILCLIIDRYEESSTYSKDLISYSTTWGRVCYAHIILSLSMADLNPSENRWHEELQTRYKYLLDIHILEAHTLLGIFLNQFYYLNKGWVRNQLDHLANDINSENWKAFIIGLMHLQDGLYKEVYSLMRPHYQMLFEQFHQVPSNHFKAYRQRFVRHITQAYLSGWENWKKESIWLKLIKTWQWDDIVQIIEVCHSQGEYLQKDHIDEASRDFYLQIQTNILDFWQYTYEKYRAFPEINSEDERVVAYLASLIAILPQIDKQNYEWLQFSYKYLIPHWAWEQDHIKEFNRLKDKGDPLESGMYIGKLYVVLLEKCLPDSRKVVMESLLGHLYELQDSKIKELADEICNIYATQGREDLVRGVYQKYQTVTDKSLQ